MAIDPRYIINLNGKSYPLYSGILGEAHALGLQSLLTRILQIPTPENEYTAIVEATAMFPDGRVFTDIGDASPKNVNARIATALLRMASTRAKGRALRDAINCGETMLEELPDMTAEADSALPDSRGDRQATQPHPASQRAVQGAERETTASRVRMPGPTRADGQPICSGEGCGKALTSGQVEVSTRAYGQQLCPACQKLHAKLG
jgi:hypothetical protein